MILQKRKPIYFRKQIREIFPVKNLEEFEWSLEVIRPKKLDIACFCYIFK